MLIIEPSCELWQQKDPITHVARCARVCYGNKGKSTDKQLYDSLLKAKHYSMFRHESVYAIIPKKHKYQFLDEVLYVQIHSPYVGCLQDDKFWYISTNMNHFLDLRKDFAWHG